MIVSRAARKLVATPTGLNKFSVKLKTFISYKVL